MDLPAIDLKVDRVQRLYPDIALTDAFHGKEYICHTHTSHLMLIKRLRSEKWGLSAGSKEAPFCPTGLESKAVDVVGCDVNHGIDFDHIALK